MKEAYQVNSLAIDRTPSPVSLFDNRNTWLTEPKIAVSEFFASDRFRSFNRSAVLLPDKHKLRAGSTKVYLSMFEKFSRYLTEHQRNFLDVSDFDIRVFMNGDLDTSLGPRSAETRLRYARLTERIFEHLQQTGLRDSNPVSTWIKANGGVNPTPNADKGAKAPTVSAAKVNLLQDWLYAAGCNYLELGEWRTARDITLASLSLGSGMRCAELLLLTRGQVKFWPGGPMSDRFEFEIPVRSSVETARAHRTLANRDCVAIMEKWWGTRWVGFKMADDDIKVPAGERIFPATLSGKPLTPSTLFRNLKEVASDALKAGALDESSRWVLERGAQGLRRAFVLSSLEQGVDPSLLTERLGHWTQRSVRRYLNNDSPVPCSQGSNS